MKLTINQFLRQEAKTKNEYIKYVYELKCFKELWQQIPSNVRFPLFWVNCEAVRTELIKRINEMLELVYRDIESDIIQKANQIDHKHNSVLAYISKPLMTAEDVQRMEKYKNNMILEQSIMQDQIDEWRDWLFLLINMDHNISEQTQNLAKIIYVRK